MNAMPFPKDPMVIELERMDWILKSENELDSKTNIEIDVVEKHRVI